MARKIADAYAANPRVAAVILTGSAARGHADGFSDVELLVCWGADPEERERAAAIERAAGDLHRLYPFENGWWEDTFFAGRADLHAEKSGVLIEVVNTRVEQVERIVSDVVQKFDADSGKLSLLAGIADGVALRGEERVARWQRRVSRFPDELVVAVVKRYAQIDHFWRWRMYVERGSNLMGLHAHFAGVQERLLHVLLAVNRVYFFGFKWLDVVLARLAISPPDFAARFKRIHALPPSEAAAEVASLVHETYDLVERHVPSLEAGFVDRLRAVFDYERPVWRERPPL